MSKCILNDCILWQSHGQRVRIVEQDNLFDTGEPSQLAPIVEWLWSDGEWHTSREGNWFAVDNLTWSLEAMTQALAVLANRVNVAFLESKERGP